MMTGIPLPFLFGGKKAMMKMKQKERQTSHSIFIFVWFFFPSRFLIELCSVERFGAMRVTLALFRQVKNLIIWLIRLKIIFFLSCEIWNHKKSNFHTVRTANSIDQIWKKKKKGKKEEFVCDVNKAFVSVSEAVSRCHLLWSDGWAMKLSFHCFLSWVPSGVRTTGMFDGHKLLKWGGGARGGAVGGRVGGAVDLW